MPGPQSSFKKILNEKIKEITRAARSTPNRSPIPWFHRGEVMELLAKAFENKATQVLLDGMRFDIDYKKDGRAIVKPSNGDFIPRANFDTERFIKRWEDHQAAFRVTRLTDEG